MLSKGPGVPGTGSVLIHEKLSSTQGYIDCICAHRGSNPHKSSKDPSDDKQVITVSYHTASGTRVLSIHAHDDGTWKEFMSRTGKRIMGIEDE
ncbi:hypothetical protein AJ80_03224 [Polytolypa hystricis UAMH7299]|uniref:Uncharacterized protein n=1 Tax=Polytolypa hystricis (strain UAMH7299) TaxID=1447883 RepID=A0A2B7YKA1_POLH7|nr:hypothetical protein AJ80_03224 [Polytolypa hystricis UAMH7299]